MISALVVFPGTIGGFATPTGSNLNPVNGGRVSPGDDYAPSSAGSMSYEFSDGSMHWCHPA